MSTFLDANGFQEDDNSQVLQSSAAATGNGNSMIIRGQEAVLINVAGITTATIVIKAQDSTGAWNALNVINALNGVQASSITANGQYSVVFVGMLNLRARYLDAISIIV
jgi:hypothetical protein